MCEDRVRNDYVKFGLEDRNRLVAIARGVNSADSIDCNGASGPSEISASKFQCVKVNIEAPVVVWEDCAPRISQKVPPVAAEIENPQAIPSRRVQDVVEV